MTSRPAMTTRKARGAFFTPPAIADFLADWAVGNDPSATVLDPTCGEAVFLMAAARRLASLGASREQIARQAIGIDLHQPSLDESLRLLRAEGLDACLMRQDFFEVPSPQQLGCSLPAMDAVIGNPPFIRYQEHRGDVRKRSLSAALAQGVPLSGLASSWAALVVHACAFLKPDGRLAMVLPAELLTVQYAEPVRQWLKKRFAAVHLVMFERLQFEDALEKVVLVVARGSGGCDSFSLHYVADAQDLPDLHVFDSVSAVVGSEGKWTNLLLPLHARHLFKEVTEQHFVPLSSYGSPELGTVTGANGFFTMSERSRLARGLTADQVSAMSPPGTRHLRGLSFTKFDWEQLRDADERVWLLWPRADDTSQALQAYLSEGETTGIDTGYKCRTRSPWWRPPRVAPPDFFFTYMSHRYPRLIANRAKVTFLNSMHGVRLRRGVARHARQALPLLAFNSATMLGAEIHGRSYGGGILKMEPREAAVLPLPNSTVLESAWEVLAPEREDLDRQVRAGLWMQVVSRVDEVILRHAAGLSYEAVEDLRTAAAMLRARRTGSTHVS